jgi:hypothetical protein
MADPIDATKQCHFVHVRIWCQGKLEDNLWLYPWLSETRERKGVAEIGEVMNRLVVDISPDRFTYSVFGPKRAIREPDLASHRYLAVRLAHLSYCSSHTVSSFKIEPRKAR